MKDEQQAGRGVELAGDFKYGTANRFMKGERVSNAESSKSQAFGQDGVVEFKGALLHLLVLVNSYVSHALIVTHQRSAEVRGDNGSGFDPLCLVLLDEGASKGAFAGSCWSTEHSQRTWRNADGGLALCRFFVT